MSTGNISLDILLNQIKTDAIAKSEEAVQSIRKRYPSLSLGEALEIHKMIVASMQDKQEATSLVVTAPPSFAIPSKVTKSVVEDMLNRARSSILITGYSLSDYFSDMIDVIIKKSQQGILVKFYVNNIKSQRCFDRLLEYQGRFLEIYNYPNQSVKKVLHALLLMGTEKRPLLPKDADTVDRFLLSNSIERISELASHTMLTTRDNVCKQY